MRILSSLALATLIACGGGEQQTTPAPAPTPAAPAPTPAAPAPEPAAEEQKAEEVDFDSLSPEEQKAHLMKVGEEVYKTGGGGIACITCHMENGMGTPGAFPPLVGEDAKKHMGDCVNHAGIVINGMTGEIVVDGVTYNGVMTPQGDMLSDLQIAAVITYERNSWGNDFGDCTPADVAKAR